MNTIKSPIAVHALRRLHSSQLLVATLRRAILPSRKLRPKSPYRRRVVSTIRRSIGRRGGFRADVALSNVGGSNLRRLDAGWTYGTISG